MSLNDSRLRTNVNSMAPQIDGSLPPRALEYKKARDANRNRLLGSTKKKKPILLKTNHREKKVREINRQNTSDNP